MTNGDAKNKHITLAYSIAYNSCVFNRAKGAQIVLFGFFGAHQNRWVSKSNCHPPFDFSDKFLCRLTIRRKWIGLKKSGSSARKQKSPSTILQKCKCKRAERPIFVFLSAGDNNEENDKKWFSLHGEWMRVNFHFLLLKIMKIWV